MVCGVFTDKEADGVGDKESGYTTTVDIHTLRGLFKHVPGICQFH